LLESPARDYACEPRSFKTRGPHIGPLQALRVDETPCPVDLGRSRTRWAIALAVLVVGVLVLPHLAINGHHYRFWLIP
jgi:hypothetical protein